MASGKKLSDKASKLDFSNLPGFGGGRVASSPAPVSAETHRPKTAPGAMMAFAVDARSELIKENEALRAQALEHEALQGRASEMVAELAQWEGATATRLLDPKRIARSKWANRAQASFEDAEFAALKEELASAGGNVQPIKVRQVGQDGEGPLYEIVFGHRRHQGCLDLGLPVLAMVDNLSDQSLFVEMDRENRSRKNLSAWEQGQMYLKALDDGLFASQRKLAEAVGADVGNLGKALRLARLPAEVVAAFASPLDLQYRFAQGLDEAYQRDAQGLIKRAQGIAQQRGDRTPKRVYDALVSTGEGFVDKEEGVAAVVPVQVGGLTQATISASKKGTVTVTLNRGVLAPSRLQDLASLLQGFLEQG